MNRSIPLWIAVWLFLVIFLFFVFFTFAFGWALKANLRGTEPAGIWGEAAVEIAYFPSTAQSVLVELFNYASGTYRDNSLRVEREEDDDYSEFVPVPVASGVDVKGLLMRIDREKMIDGWRLLVGAFAVDGEIENAVVLLSPDLEAVKVWILDEVPIGDLEPRPKHRKFVHGLSVLRDGSLIFTFDGSISLQRIDACGKRQWAIGGEYHHAVTLDDTGETVWTFDSEDTIVQVAVEDGSILRRFSMDDVIASNPMIDILEISRQHSSDLGENTRNTKGIWTKNTFHLNDVDPLPAAIADRFGDFDTGDLAVSARNLNLVFVVDPDTLEVKWWRSGAMQRQHDPDWLPNGEIMVLNNRMSRDFSEIISIDPETFERTTLFDGRKNDFYTRIRGKLQRTADGTLVVTSSQQGRAFEVNRDGDVVFEIVNTKPGSDTVNYAISEMMWLPLDHFDIGDWVCAQDG